MKMLLVCGKGIAAISLIAFLTGCMSADERRILERQDERMQSRLDEVQAQLITLHEQQQRQPMPISQAPTQPFQQISLSPDLSVPQVPVRSDIDEAARRASEGSRSGSTKSKPRYQDLAAKHVRVKDVSVRRVQAALKGAGHDPGKIDGIMGSKTIAAIRDFQKAKGLTADGVVGPKTWDVLRASEPPSVGGTPMGS